MNVYQSVETCVCSSDFTENLFTSLGFYINPLAGRATFLSPTVHGRSDNIVVFP